jgi:hypothetical protein
VIEAGTASTFTPVVVTVGRTKLLVLVAISFIEEGLISVLLIVIPSVSKSPEATVYSNNDTLPVVPGITGPTKGLSDS